MVGVLILAAMPPLTAADVVVERPAPPPLKPPPAELGGDGEVTLVCNIQEDGALRGCATVQERPAGYGLAAWTADMVTTWRVAPTSKDGRPTAGRQFRIPVRFKPAD